jgi:hypothetical protein
MNIFKDDLFKNKYFVIMLAIGAVVIGALWLADYYSIESKCERYAQESSALLGLKQGNKLRDLQLKTALSPLIQDCIERGGPAAE